MHRARVPPLARLPGSLAQFRLRRGRVRFSRRAFVPERSSRDGEFGVGGVALRPRVVDGVGCGALLVASGAFERVQRRVESRGIFPVRGARGVEGRLGVRESSAEDIAFVVSRANFVDGARTLELGREEAIALGFVSVAEGLEAEGVLAGRLGDAELELLGRRAALEGEEDAGPGAVGGALASKRARVVVRGGRVTTRRLVSSIHERDVFAERRASLLGVRRQGRDRGDELADLRWVVRVGVGG